MGKSCLIKMARLTALCLTGLSLFFNAPKAFTEPIRSVPGILDALQKGTLLLHETPDVSYEIPVNPSLKVIQFSRYALPLNWLYPGDGVRVILGNHGRAEKIESAVSWYFGTVAFTLSNRLTLLEGNQFFIQNAPVFLNGENTNLTALKPPEEVLVRFDASRQRVVGIWAFDFRTLKREPPDVLDVHAWISSGKNYSQALHVGVKMRTPGKASVQLLGVSGRIPIPEKSKGEFQGMIPLPAGLAVPRSYLSVEWNTVLYGESIHESWISQIPISFYTQKPVIVETGPPDGSRVPVNPPFVFACFDPTGATPDIKSLKLEVDGKNVTQESYVDSYHVFYAPPRLRPGKHQCLLTGRSLGQTASFSKKWNFYVLFPGGRHVSHVSKTHP